MKPPKRPITRRIMKANKLIIFAGIFVSSLFLTGAVNAATWTVTKSANSNDGSCDTDCSLREAVAAADSGDTVIFNSNLIGQTFTLGGNQIVVSKRIVIDGAIDSVNVAFISGSNTSRHFLVVAGGGLDLRNAILVQGEPNLFDNPGFNGGAIFAEANSSVQLDRVSIRGNSAPTNLGGAIYSDDASIHIVNSSITGNQADRCAAVAFYFSRVDIANTTISNNRRVVGGNNAGAVCSFDSETTIRNSTIARNISERSTLIITDGNIPGFPSVVNLGNTIIADNEHDIGADVDNNLGAADIVSVGGNLIGTTVNVAPGTFTLPQDTLGQNPLLAPTNSLQGGHPVDTHPLQAGSPATGTGINANAIDPRSGLPLTQDARGSVFPRISGGTVDKGAFEDQSDSSSLVVTKLTNSNDNVCDTDCSLREAVFAASLDPGTDNITMAANVFGTMIVGTEIQINNHDVNIIGYPSISSNALIVSGNDVSRVFRLENANVTMTGFTIADGTGAGQSQPFGGGGMLVSGGNLTLNQMIVRNNATVASDLGSGGGLAVFGGSVVRIMNSTVNNNSSYSSLGAKIEASVIYITNTTIANNLYLSPGEAGLGALTINGTLYMRNSTIASNRSAASPTGAGLFCGATSTCNVGNTIFADNLAATGADLYVSPGGTLNSVGGNLVEITTGFNNALMNQPNDALGVDPVLMALANNGGNVTTQMLGISSPASNTGINTNATDPFSALPLTTDARGAGFPRIVGTVDKGAFEGLQPSAAGVTVAGRVKVGGRGLTNAIVTIIDHKGSVRSAMTSSFGYFKFENVEVGQTYVVSVQSKRYTFSSQVIDLTDELSDLVFVAEQ